ncbi:MAG: hypothetical protein AAGF04_05620 [Chlamydiota bacterium]
MIAGFSSKERLIITYDNYQAYFVSSDEVFGKIRKAVEEQEAIEITAKAEGQVSLREECDQSVKLMNAAITFQSLKNPQAIKNGEIEIARKTASKIASHLEEGFRYQCNQALMLMAKAKALTTLTNFYMQTFIIDESIILNNRQFIIRLDMGTETDLFTQVREHLNYMAEDLFGNAMLVVGLHVCVVALICFALTPVSVPLGLAAASIALLAPPLFFSSIYTCLSDKDLRQAARDLESWENEIKTREEKDGIIFLQKKKITSYEEIRIIVRGKVKTLSTIFPGVSENSKEIYCSKFFRLLSPEMRYGMKNRPPIEPYS